MDSKEVMLLKGRMAYQKMIEQSHKLGACEKVSMMDMAQMLSDTIEIRENKRRLLLTL